MGRRIGLAALFMGSLLLVQGCVTPAPQTLTFGPQSGTGLLVVAGPPAGAATHMELRRVNLETRLFEDEIVPFINAGLGGHQIDPNSNIWLSLREVAGGDYAVVSLSMNTFNGVAQGQVWRCFSGRAPVYRLPRGQISMVQLASTMEAIQSGQVDKPIASEALVLAEFERVRPNYPGVIGEARMVLPSAMISWQEVPGIGWTRNCREPPQFTLQPMLLTR